MAPNEPSPPAIPSLADLIEHERRELAQIHAMTKCLTDVLLYSDDDDATMHADVADVVARLLDDTIARLDVVRTRVAQLEAAVQEHAYSIPSTPPDEVREIRATYSIPTPRMHEMREIRTGHLC